MIQYFDSRYTGLCICNNMVLYAVRLQLKSSFLPTNPYIYNINMISDLISEHSCVTPILFNHKSGQLSYYGGIWLCMSKEQFGVKMGNW